MTLVRRPIRIRWTRHGKRGETAETEKGESEWPGTRLFADAGTSPARALYWVRLVRVEWAKPVAQAMRRDEFEEFKP